MFGWFGNNDAIYESGGYTSVGNVGKTTEVASFDSGWSKTGSVSKSGGGFSGGASSALSLAQAATNIMSYTSMYKQAKQNVKTAGLNMAALGQDYKINKLRLDIETYKTLGGIAARTGESGSGLDLLQESAFNAAVDAIALEQEYNMRFLQAYRDYKKAKKAKNKANAGRLGAAIGTTAAIVAAPFTGGSSLAFAGQASQMGGQAFSSFA